MTVHIIRIEDYVVSCSLVDGTIIDIDRKWLPEKNEIDEEVEFCVEKSKL